MRPFAVDIARPHAGDHLGSPYSCRHKQLPIATIASDIVLLTRECADALVDIARIYAETDGAAARRLNEFRPPGGYRLAG